MFLLKLKMRRLNAARTRRNFAIIAALFAVCFLFNVSGVSAATFVVNSTIDGQDVTLGDGVCLDNNGNCSLRAAISEANAFTTDPMDIITLPAGTYTTTRVGVDDTNVNGDLDILSNITINGAGSGTTFIEAATTPAAAVERVFHFTTANAVVVMNGVTIRNGRQATAIFGGGLRLNAAGVNVTLNNCIVRDNFSGLAGGGIIVNNATASLTLNNTTVTNNTSAVATGANNSFGGGIYVSVAGATLTATDSTISNNTASNASTTAGTDARGGGIFSSGTVTLTNTTVSNNTISATVATSIGGGIYHQGAIFTLNNSNVSGNTATAAGANSGLGGGIAQFTGTVNVNDSTITTNTATSSGTGNGTAGGIYQQLSTLNITRSTVSSNNAANRAGVYTIASTAATTTINSSAIVNNTSSVAGSGGITNLTVGAANAVTNINNSTVGGNMTAASGGGIENFTNGVGAATVNINFSTIAGNAANTDNTGADGGGGLANLIGTGAGAGVIQITNSIVADNTIGTGGTGPDISGTITSGNYNHVENLAGGTFAPMANDVTGTDPKLTPLALNGGTTLNYKPAPTSPVLDTIPTGTNGCGTAPFDVDQRNMVRPTDSNNDMLAACEKGADEVIAVTAAGVSIKGQVLNGTGKKAQGIANAIVTMVDGFGNTRVTRTNSFGYYQFDDVEVGQTYVFYVSARRYQFGTQAVSINNEVNNYDFTPIE